MATRVARWIGRVKPGAENRHKAYLEWLQTREAASIFSRYLLDAYRLSQRNEYIEVAFQSRDPAAIIRFLRHSQMWPSFWEYLGADWPPAAAGAEDGRVLVEWRRVTPDS